MLLRELVELALHLLAIRLGIARGCYHGWRSLPRNMAQAAGHLFRGKANDMQPMAEVVPQIMEGVVSNLLPLLFRRSLFDAPPPGM